MNSIKALNTLTDKYRLIQDYHNDLILLAHSKNSKENKTPFIIGVFDYETSEALSSGITSGLALSLDTTESKINSILKEDGINPCNNFITSLIITGYSKYLNNFFKDDNVGQLVKNSGNVTGLLSLMSQSRGIEELVISAVRFRLPDLRMRKVLIPLYDILNEIANQCFNNAEAICTGFLDKVFNPPEHYYTDVLSNGIVKVSNDSGMLYISILNDYNILCLSSFIAAVKANYNDEKNPDSVDSESEETLEEVILNKIPGVRKEIIARFLSSYI
jgi:hypothetical protein